MVYQLNLSVHACMVLIVRVPDKVVPKLICSFLGSLLVDINVPNEILELQKNLVHPQIGECTMSCAKPVSLRWY